MPSSVSGSARSALVRHSSGVHAGVERGDQGPVDQPRPGLGVGERGDHDQLVGVGHDDPLDGVVVVGGAAQHGRRARRPRRSGPATPSTPETSPTTRTRSPTTTPLRPSGRDFIASHPDPVDRQGVAAPVDGHDAARRRRRRTVGAPWCGDGCAAAGARSARGRARRSGRSPRSGPHQQRRPDAGEVGEGLGGGGDVLDQRPRRPPRRRSRRRGPSGGRRRCGRRRRAAAPGGSDSPSAQLGDVGAERGRARWRARASRSVSWPRMCATPRRWEGDSASAHSAATAGVSSPTSCRSRSTPVQRRRCRGPRGPRRRSATEQPIARGSRAARRPPGSCSRGQSRTTTTVPPVTAASARNGAALDRSGSIVSSTAPRPGPGATAQRFGVARRRPRRRAPRSIATVISMWGRDGTGLPSWRTSTPSS